MQVTGKRALQEAAVEAFKYGNDSFTCVLPFLIKILEGKGYSLGIFDSQGPASTVNTYGLSGPACMLVVAETIQLP